MDLYKGMEMNGNGNDMGKYMRWLNLFKYL